MSQPQDTEIKKPGDPGRNAKGQAGNITSKERLQTQARTQVRKVQTDKGHRKHASQNRRSDTPRNKRAKRGISPTGGGNQVTRQTRGTIDRPRGTSQDCTRVFPVKGAANALCNPETDVRGGTCNWAAGHAGFRGDPSYDTPKSSGPTPAASLQDKRAKGGPALSNQGSRVLESTLPGLHFVEDIGHRWGSRREMRGAKQRRDGEVPCFSRAAYTPGNPDIGRATTSSRRRGRSRRRVGVEGRTTRIRGSRREKEARFLEFRRNRRELGDCGADHVPDGIVAQDPIPSTATSKGVISPAVENFSAHAASRVVIPQRYAKTTLEGHAEKWRRNMGIDARRVGREPSTSSRDPASLKMQAAMTRKGGVPEDSRNRLSLNHARQRPLGRGVADGIDVGARRNRATQGIFSRRKATPVVQIEGIECGPELAAQLTRSRKTGDISSGSMFSGTAGPKSASSNTQRSETPIIFSQGATDELTQCCTKVIVRSPQTTHLGTGGHSAA